MLTINEFFPPKNLIQPPETSISSHALSGD